MAKYLHIVFIYVIYLLLISSLISITTPCYFFTNPQEYSACTVDVLSNQYLTFMGLGTLFAVFTTYLFGKRTEDKAVTVLLVVLTIVILGVASYYLYLPFAIKQIGEVEVYLDSLID